MRRDPYEVLGVARDADETRDQEGLPRARARAAPGREQARPGGRGEVQGGRRGLRDPLRRRAPRDLRPLRLRGARLARLRLAARTASARSRDIFDAFFGGDPFGGGVRRRRPGPRAGRRRGRGGRGHARAGRARRAASRSQYDARRRLRALPRQRRRAGHADRDLRALRRQRASCARSRAPRSASSCASQACDDCGGEGKVAARALRASAAAAAAGRCARRSSVDVPAGIADEQRIRLTGRGHAGERGGPPGDLYVLVRVTEDERFLRDGNDLVTVVDVPAPAAALGTTRHGADARRRGGGRGAGGHAARHGGHARAGAGCRRSGAAGAATSAWSLNVVIPRNLSRRASASCSSELRETLDGGQPARAAATSRCSRRSGGRSR